MENTDRSPQNPQPSELVKIAEVGKELGFDINPDDPILREAMGEEGEYCDLQ